MTMLIIPAPERGREAAHSASGSRCRRRISVCPTRRWTLRIAAAQGGARRSPRDPRPSLPARRGDQVRRLHRRLVQARARRSPAPATPTTSCSAACTSWPRAPTCSRRRTSRSILPDLAAGCSMADMAADRSARDLLARARADGRRLDRRRARHLHQLRRRRSRRSSASTAASSARRRNAAATLKWAWEQRREDPVPARSAPRPQHRVQDGRAARPDGGVGSERAVRRPRRRTQVERRS